MNILFLTITQLEDINAGGIYPDLLKFFHEQNHNIYVVSPRERKYNLETEFFEKDKVKHLAVKLAISQKLSLLKRESQQ